MVKALAALIVLGTLILVGCGKDSEQRSSKKPSLKSAAAGSQEADGVKENQRQQHASHAQSMQDYKGAKWGADLSQVASKLNTTLSRHYGVGVFGTKPINGAFYELWGVPKDELWGRIGYRESLIPKESFRFFKTSNGDRCLFYKGRLCCYYFDVLAGNYDTYYSQIATKYGSPLESRSFPGYDTDGTKRYDISAKEWDAGKTLIFLIKDVFTAYELGMSMTSVTVAYFSKDIFEEIKSAIRGTMDAKQDLEQQRKRKLTEEDLHKIQ